MKLVILESPYAGDVEANIKFARACMRDCLLRGEAPIASHLLYTQPGVLDDSIPSERAHGIAAGLAWRFFADYSVFYTDKGWSKGMFEALHSAVREGLPVMFRALQGEPILPEEI